MKRSRGSEPQPGVPKPASQPGPPAHGPSPDAGLSHRFANIAMEGPRAVPPVVQRTVDVEKLLDTPEKRQLLFENEIGVDDLEDVQELLQHKETVQQYLMQLEQDMHHYFDRPESGAKYTSALDMALFNVESRWMNVSLASGGGPQDVDPESERPFEAEWNKKPQDAGLTSKGARETVSVESGTEKQSTFVGRIRGAKPLKDVGAPISHGEYAHRIQWYVIAKSSWDNGMVSPRWVRALYAILGAEEFIRKIEDYKTPQLPEGWTLWGAVVDVPYSATDEFKPSNPSGVGSVGFSAPVAVTKHISGGEGGLQFSQLTLAVLNRRLKRFYESLARGTAKERPDGALLTMLKGLPEKMAGDKEFEDVQELVAALLESAASAAAQGQIPDYDARNALAFALSGIAPSPSYVKIGGFEPVKKD